MISPHNEQTASHTVIMAGKGCLPALILAWNMLTLSVFADDMHIYISDFKYGSKTSAQTHQSNQKTAYERV